MSSLARTIDRHMLLNLNHYHCKIKFSSSFSLAIFSLSPSISVASPAPHSLSPFSLSLSLSPHFLSFPPSSLVQVKQLQECSTVHSEARQFKQTVCTTNHIIKEAFVRPKYCLRVVIFISERITVLTFEYVLCVAYFRIQPWATADHPGSCERCDSAALGQNP